MSEWLTCTLIALATYRATRFIIDDRLLRTPIDGLQEWFENRHLKKKDKEATEEWQSQVAYLISCPWCVSAYTGAAIIAAATTTTSVPLPLATWAAASAVTGLLSTYEHRDDKDA